MIKVGVTADIEQALSLFDSLAKDQVPYATMLGINAAAEAGKQAAYAEMDRAFDRPTPYTKNSLYIRYATKQRLEATVEIKNRDGSGNPVTNYLWPEVEGGPRRRKGFENLLGRAGLLPSGWYAVPTSYAPFDAFGNVPGPTILSILKQIQASSNAQKNETAARKKTLNRTRATGRYYAITPADAAKRNKTPGIYERIGSGFGGATRPIFIFTSKQPKYRDRYHFYAVGERAARAAFPRAMILGIEKAIATQRKR